MLSITHTLLLLLIAHMCTHYIHVYMIFFFLFHVRLVYIAYHVRSASDRGNGKVAILAQAGQCTSRGRKMSKKAIAKRNKILLNLRQKLRKHKRVEIQTMRKIKVLSHVNSNPRYMLT